MRAAQTHRRGLQEELALRYEDQTLAVYPADKMPPFDAGAHIDVVIAPEYQRPYSLVGDPADRGSYLRGVLREPPDRGSRGGSALMHRAFREGRRADLAALIPNYETGFHTYTCGAPRFMDGVFEATSNRGWPEAALHREYFSVPEAPAWVNRPFVLLLSRSARTLAVPADRSATEVLAEAGLGVVTKCSDGLCGVCATRYDAAASGAIEHRDFVLSAAERAQRVILCCSRARDEGGEIVVEL